MLFKEVDEEGSAVGSGLSTSQEESTQLLNHLLIAVRVTISCFLLSWLDQFAEKNQFFDDPQTLSLLFPVHELLPPLFD